MSSTASASATATRTTTRAPTSTSNTCPTLSPIAATTTRPSQGYEATIAGRMAGRREARAAGSRKAVPPPAGPDAWQPSGDIMTTRETNRRKLAETEKRDAEG